MTESKEVRQLKVGRVVLIDDEPCEVESISLSKPGKHGSAKANIEAVSIFNKTKKMIILPVSSTIKVPLINKIKVLILTITNTEIYLLNLEDNTTFEINIDENWKQEKNWSKIIEGAEVICIEIMGKYKFL